MDCNTGFSINWVTEPFSCKTLFNFLLSALYVISLVARLRSSCTSSSSSSWLMPWLRKFQYQLIINRVSKGSEQNFADKHEVLTWTNENLNAWNHHVEGQKHGDPHDSASATTPLCIDFHKQNNEVNENPNAHKPHTKYLTARLSCRFEGHKQYLPCFPWGGKSWLDHQAEHTKPKPWPFSPPFPSAVFH